MSDNPFQAPDSALARVRALDDHIDIPVGAGARLGAYLIDGLFLVVLVGIFAFGVGIMMATLSGDPEDPGVGLVFQLVAWLTMFFYTFAFEMGPWHATPGKKLLGLQVVSAHGGDADVGAILVRNLVKTVGLGFCGLLAFSVLAGEEGSSLWDGVAKTRVVRRVPTP